MFAKGKARSAFPPPPPVGDPRGKTQDTLERVSHPAGLETPWNHPWRTGGCVQAEGSLLLSAWTAAPVTRMDGWMDEWWRAYTSVICEGFCDFSQCYYSSQLSSWWKEHLLTGWMIFSYYSLLFLPPEDQSTTTEHILLLHLPNHDSNILEKRSPVTEFSLSLWERAVKPFRARQLLEVPKILAARYFAKPLDGFYSIKINKTALQDCSLLIMMEGTNPVHIDDNSRSTNLTSAEWRRWAGDRLAWRLASTTTSCSIRSPFTSTVSSHRYVSVFTYSIC